MTAGHEGHLVGAELALRPILAGMLVIGLAGDALGGPAEFFGVGYR